MSATSPATASFRELELPNELIQALEAVGYETPTPIQAQAIPALLQGRDLLGHAPTGTGKTAAFALPLLARLDISRPVVQVMTLTPTRELAIQVAEAFKRYAAHIRDFHVLPIYGGQEYTGQLRQLKRGVHVVVGTPGRVMDHMRKGTLRLEDLRTLVLDEADEMLRMGFIDEVEWILQRAPDQRQMALFSATMPKEIQRMTRRYLREPAEISIKARTATAETIHQRYWLVSGLHKLEALTRILEVEPFDGILLFVRTKTATGEIAERLEARGYAAAPMNGDMPQKQREQTVNRFKSGALDILVATDVAARGLDVDRISHVINYDIPYDTEAYIHRIGRTGRAGRLGEAILFVAPRERHMLHAIERATRHKIEPLELPSTETVNNKRIADFKQKITDALATGELAFMQGVVEQYQQEHDVPAMDIAAALATLAIGAKPLLVQQEKHPRRSREEASRTSAPDRERAGARSRNRPARENPDSEKYRIEVGLEHGVKPGNIVGAIANEAGLDAQHIGHVEIHEDHSVVELPRGMPRDVFRDLKKVWVCGTQLKISRLEDRAATSDRKRTAKSATDRSARERDTRSQPERNRRGAPVKPKRSIRKRPAADTSANQHISKTESGTANNDDSAQSRSAPAKRRGDSDKRRGDSDKSRGSAEKGRSSSDKKRSSSDKNPSSSKTSSSKKSRGASKKRKGGKVKKKREPKS